MTSLILPLGLSIFYLLCLGFGQEQELHNVTQWSINRQKRTLIWPDLGVHKYIVSFAYPVELFDKKSWRGLYGSWNFQWQHNTPLTVLYWWNSTYFPVQGRGMSSEQVARPYAPPIEPIDLTAIFLYATIESYMDSKGLDGRECLLRAICENAQVNYVGGVFDKIYQRFLKPEPHMEDYYKDAYTMGSVGADCYESFSGCPKGSGVFDNFVHIEEVDQN